MMFGVARVNLPAKRTFPGSRSATLTKKKSPLMKHIVGQLTTVEHPLIYIVIPTTVCNALASGKKTSSHISLPMTNLTLLLNTDVGSISVLI